MKPLFLRWCLVQSVFALALSGAAFSYKGHVHPVAYAAIGLVLAVYACGAGYAGTLAWRGEGSLRPLDRAASYCPKCAMLGTVGGFLIAFSGSTSDVAQRVQGASTGLAATLVGIACMLLLEWQADLIEAHRATQ